MDIKDSWIVNQFIAHKGFFNTENPENTLGAFQRAMEHNYAIECDLKIIKDDTIIICHEDTLAPITNGDGYLANMTYDEIKDLKVKNSQFGIPTLQDLLKLVQGKVPILFDIKSMNTRNIGKLEQKLCDELEKYNGEYAISSSNPYVTLWFKNNKPNIWRGITSSFYRNEEEGKQFVKTWIVRKLLKRMVMNKKIKPDFIVYNWANLPNRFVNKYKNLPIIAWTVRSQEEYLKVIKYADNIIFDSFEPKI